MKLGKLAPKANAKTLLFAKYLLPDAPPPPPEKTFWEYKIPPATIGMYGNDTIGDCTCAAIAHLIMLITAHTGTMVAPELGDVIAMYSAISGYDPSQTDSEGNNPTDTGCAITDVLDYMQTTGLAGFKIDGWAALDITNRQHMNQAVNLFLAVDEGVQLPAVAQIQFAAGQNWEVVPDDGGIEGGHDILRTGFGSQGQNYQSWGKGDQKAGLAWSTQYTDEGYIVLTDKLIDAASGLSPTGLNYSQLAADLAALKA